MAFVYELNGMVPVIDPAAFVHPTAVLIGDVHVGAEVYVGPGASLRGDFGRLILEEGSNFQDNCIMHGFPDRDCVVEREGHIGHGAIIHGAHIGRNALIGMNAVIMDYATIGENSVVAALAMVKAHDDVPANTVVAGTPARKIRDVTKQQAEGKRRATGEYQRLARVCRERLRAAEPLSAAEENRPRDYVLQIGSMARKK